MYFHKKLSGDEKINWIKKNVKGTLAVEGIEPSKETENITDLFLIGKVSSKKSILKIKSLYQVIKVNKIQEFEDIKNCYYLYKVKNICFVMNHNTNKRLNEFKKESRLNGYMYLKLATKNNTYKNIRFHRLVANAFIEKCDTSFDEVHHKDSNKENNNIDNLEWTDRKTNMNYIYNSQNKDDSGFIDDLLNGGIL
jgi:hypothetical protein